MDGAIWGDAASPELDWRMSAALENVPRGDADLAEVTNLETAVRAWVALDAAHRAAATLTPERPILIDGASMPTFYGDGIAALVERLPGGVRTDDTGEAPDEAG